MSDETINTSRHRCLNCESLNTSTVMGGVNPRRAKVYCYDCKQTILKTGPNAYDSVKVTLLKKDVFKKRKR